MDNKDLENVFSIIPRLKHELFKNNSISTLNKTQDRTLMIIKCMQGQKMTDICRHTGIEKGSFTRVVDKLIEIGYVERIRPESDRRTVLLYLTKEGEDYAALLVKTMNDHLRERFSVLTEEEEKEFLNALYILDKTAEKVFAKWREN